jgi:hypothetical protein
MTYNSTGKRITSGKYGARPHKPLDFIGLYWASQGLTPNSGFEGEVTTAFI